MEGPRKAGLLWVAENILENNKQIKLLNKQVLLLVKSFSLIVSSN